VDTSRAACRIAEDRLSAQIDKLQERLRRIGLLEVETGVRPADPLTGRWRVTILPQNLSAVFDLHLDGTIVSGILPGRRLDRRLLPRHSRGRRAAAAAHRLPGRLRQHLGGHGGRRSDGGQLDIQ